MSRMYRPIRDVEPLTPQAAASEGGRGGGAAVFVIGLVGGIAAVGFYEWKVSGAGPQTAAAEVVAATPAAAPQSTPAGAGKRRDERKEAAKAVARPAGVTPPRARSGRAPAVRDVSGPRPASRSSAPAGAPPKSPRWSRPTAGATQTQTIGGPRGSGGPAVGGAGITPESVTIGRVLVGAEALRAGLVEESEAREVGRSDRYIVYFGLSVATGGARRVTFEDFRLEDASGLIYAPMRTRDALGTAGAPSAGAGGVAFAVYNDSAPARLLVRVSGERFVALPESVFRAK